MKTYCIVCKEKADNTNPKVIKTKIGKLMMSSK